jgi:hypothetical protein
VVRPGLQDGEKIVSYPRSVLQNLAAVLFATANKNMLVQLGTGSSTSFRGTAHSLVL